MKNLFAVLLFTGILMGCAVSNSLMDTSSKTLAVENLHDVGTLPQTGMPGTAEMTPSPLDVDKYVALAKRDLADRLKIDVAQIILQKTMEITWQNIAIGCIPDAGQILIKGRVNGYRVWLESQGEEYIYHVGLNGQVILCPKLLPGENNPLLKTPDGTYQDPQNQAP